MNCQEIMRIVDELDVGSLSQAELRGVDSHIGTCVDCGEQWRMNLDVQGLRYHTPVVPESLRTKLKALRRGATSAIEQRRVRRSALVTSAFLIAGAAAGAIVAIQAIERSSEAVAPMSERTPDEQPAGTASGEPVTPTTVDDAQNARSPNPAGEARRAVPTAAGVSIALDLASVAVLPVVLLDTENEALLAAANEVRADIIRRFEQSGQLNLIDPELVERYYAAGLTDIEIGRTLGVGSVVFVRAEERDGQATISYGTLDPATDRELYYGTVAMTDGSLSAAAIRVNEMNAENLVSRLILAAYPGVTISREQSIAENQATALNSSLSEAERIDALGELRSLRPEARNDSVVAAAIEIASNADDPNVRMRAWSTLSDVENPAVVQPLLNAMRYDSSEMVRGTAARLLGEYADEAGVRQALEFAATGDEDAGVREQAALAALSDQERFARVRATFFDRNLPASERVGALTSHFGRIGPGLPIDPDIADELLEIELDPAVGATWAGTLLYYADELDPKFVDPLLALLAGEPEHRAFAANVLAHFNDRAAVVEALERALEDPDRTVRNNAQRALERDL